MSDWHKLEGEAPAEPNLEGEAPAEPSKMDAAAMDAVGQLLRALPTLPAPTSCALPPSPRSWLQPAAFLWLLLLLPTAYLLQQMFAPSLTETALQTTPYPHWQGLLQEAQHTLLTGLQLLREVLG